MVFGSNENGRYCFGSSEVTELVPLSVPNQPLSRASLLAQIDEDTKKTEVDSKLIPNKKPQFDHLPISVGIRASFHHHPLHQLVLGPPFDHLPTYVGIIAFFPPPPTISSGIRVEHDRESCTFSLYSLTTTRCHTCLKLMAKKKNIFLSR